LLSVNEVAMTLGVTPQTVYRWTTGKLMQAVVRVGSGSVRFDPDKIRKFINARRP
jgi:excisionase family DNA binding protein